MCLLLQGEILLHQKLKINKTCKVYKNKIKSRKTNLDIIKDKLSQFLTKYLDHLNKEMCKK